jgi:hypothetical protein
MDDPVSIHGVIWMVQRNGIIIVTGKHEKVVIQWIVLLELGNTDGFAIFD